jgi:hypothetical protein
MSAHATYANIRFEQNLKIKPERIVKIYSINLCSKSAAYPLCESFTLMASSINLKVFAFYYGKDKITAQREMNEE